MRARQECFDAIGMCTRLQNIFTFTRQTARKKMSVYSIHEFCIDRHYCSICWVTNFTTNERTCGTPKTIFNIYDLRGATEIRFNIMKPFFVTTQTPHTFRVVCLLFRMSSLMYITARASVWFQPFQQRKWIISFEFGNTMKQLELVERGTNLCMRIIKK